MFTSRSSLLEPLAQFVLIQWPHLDDKKLGLLLVDNDLRDMKNPDLIAALGMMFAQWDPLTMPPAIG